MDSPSSGFRRAAAASWALTGIGIVGVAGTSVLAYTDTVKAPPAPSPAGVVELAPSDPGLGAVPPVAPAPEAVTTTTVDPPPPLMVAVEQEPESGETSDYRPDYTPEYPPETTVAQVPTTVDAPAAARPDPSPTTRYHRITPRTVAAPSYSPPIVRSRGS